ncbi:MAG: hypothetical protein AB7U73_09380 [Pirellulales bacterium]
MPTKLVVGLIAGAAFLGLCYYETADQVHGPLPSEYQHGPEAASWLRASENESALASNRFYETTEALKFVEQLYRAGARRVIVPRPAIVDDGVETYADSLVVSLPSDPARRQRVWELCVAELRGAGVRPPATPTEDDILLWWD